MASSQVRIFSCNWVAAAAVNSRHLPMSRNSRALASILAGALLISPFALRARAHDRITTKVTWEREIAPIVAARCAGCHTAGGRSTIALATYDEARPWAAAIKEEVLTRRMPKWNAARGYGDFANDPSLSPFEIALVAAWVDGGAPQREKATDTGSVQATGAVAASPATNHQPTRIATLGCKDQAISGRLLAV